MGWGGGGGLLGNGARGWGWGGAGSLYLAEHFIAQRKQ